MEQNIGVLAGNWEILHIYGAHDSFRHNFTNTVDGSFEVIFATKQGQNGAKYRKRKAMPSKIWKVIGQNNDAPRANLG